jgi:assimilatory nitrate reductase catalytic subunit
LRNPHSPKIIVIDPIKTETAMAATQHYAIRPKSDLRFLYGLAHILIQNDWLDRKFIEQHTNDFEAFSEHVQRFPPELAEEASGIPVEQIQTLARTVHEGKRVSFWWTMGVNQSHEGVRVAQAIIN